MSFHYTINKRKPGPPPTGAIPKKEDSEKKKFVFTGKFGSQIVKEKPKSPVLKPVEASEECHDDFANEAPSYSELQTNPDRDEEELFQEKAILYRFDTASKEWKERGQGFMKILKNKDTNMCRILMRRNQTFRVCANHFILPHMEIKPNQGSDRAFIWYAVDFAEGVESHDTLSIRFKGPEEANKFKEAFENAKKTNKEILDKKESSSPEKAEEKNIDENKSDESAKEEVEKTEEKAKEIEDIGDKENKEENKE